MQNLVANVLSVMGLEPLQMSNSDTLGRLGIDSMQEVEVRVPCQSTCLPSPFRQTAAVVCLDVCCTSIAECTRQQTVSCKVTVDMAGLQVRANLQKALGRPVALSDIRTTTIAELRAIEGRSAESSADSNGKAAANGHANGHAHAPEQPVAPLICPAKLIDLSRDWPVSVPPKRAGFLAPEYSVQPGNKGGPKGHWVGNRPAAVNGHAW